LFQFRISGFYFFTNPIEEIISYQVIVTDSDVFSIYSISYFCLNYLFFLLLNTILEVVIVRRLHTESAEKNNRLEEMNQMDARTRRKLEMDSKKELRSIVMVVVNSLTNFFLRLPEMLVFISSQKDVLGSFSGINFFWQSNSDDLSNLKSFLVDVSYFTFIHSLTTNGCMYYLFNTKFKQKSQWWSNVK
jgi:hypothetical protein